MGVMRRAVWVVVLLVLLAGCSGAPSGGDAAACQAFSAVTGQVDAAIERVNSDGSATAKAAYRALYEGLPALLRDAADRADSAELASAMTDAADLWQADNSTAYYLAVESVARSCG